MCLFEAVHTEPIIFPEHQTEPLLSGHTQKVTA